MIRIRTDPDPVSNHGVSVIYPAKTNKFKFRICVERVTRIANSIEPFTSLYFDDQAALLKENADLLVSLRGAIFFDSKKNGVDQVLLSMGEGKGT